MLLRAVVQIALEAPAGPSAAASIRTRDVSVSALAMAGPARAPARSSLAHDSVMTRDPADAGVSIISVPDAAPPSAW